MPCFEHDGLSFSYLDAGDPSEHPFVFQHGLGGDISQPTAVFSPPQGWRLLALDCRGHGDTNPLGEGNKLSFSSFADDIVALMDRLGVEQAVVGGISMGAGVTLNLALRYPDRVAGLILSRPAWLDQPMPGNLKAYPLIARLLRERGREKGRELFEETAEYAELEAVEPGAGASLTSSQFGRVGAESFAPVLERLANDAPVCDRQEWRNMEIPALVLASRRDPAHPYDYGEVLAREIPYAGIVEITPKALSEERHALDVQKAIGDFLSCRCSFVTGKGEKEQ